MPTLEVLIGHLLAAKRSLSSINHVWHANEIVTTARSTILECAALKSKTAFVRKSLQDQLKLLGDIRLEVEKSSFSGREDFSETLRNLDAANDRLNQSLGVLRETTVHSAFRPGDEISKTLHDFVDETGVEGLHASLKSSIDRTNAAGADLDASIRQFDEDIISLRDKLLHWPSTIEPVSSSDPGVKQLEEPEPEVSVANAVPPMFRSLESHAKDMAELLSSLVLHFDRCVKAVKHTEGGGEAARSITGDIPEVQGGEGMSNIGEEINANLNAPLEPMSNEDYREMVLVLTKDAFEAEDVVVEIQDRILEMEQIFEKMRQQCASLKAIWGHAVRIGDDMTDLNNRLPHYVAQARSFTAVWSEENERFRSGLTELTDLHSFYEGFLNAYDNMILEVARRAHTRHKMEKVLRDAKSKLEHLHAEDVAARDIFRAEQGDYLPSDLWPSISRAPMRICFKRLSGGNLPEPQQLEGAPATGVLVDEPEGNDSEKPETIPNLPKDFIEDAYARVIARG